MRRLSFSLLVFFLFVFRLLYGLASEFWFEDELQIYLIGLKSFTLGSWPFYGPDIVYTQTQIPGALQGLLVSWPFYLFAIPEAPTIGLNFLVFIALAFFVHYISLRVKNIPEWLVWLLLMTTPWSMYATRVVNPSYVLIFSIPFFIALYELLPLYEKKYISSSWAFFLMGVCLTFIMQLHMSWVLLFALSALGFLFHLRDSVKVQIKNTFFYTLGLLSGAATLIPTLLLSQETGKEISSNIIFHGENWKNLFVILARFLSFAAYEIPYMLGANTQARLAVVREQIWMAPFAAFLYIMGFVQVIFFVYLLFAKHIKKEFKNIRLLVWASLLLLYAAFFFSVKGPSSHTFFVMFPLAILYAFYAYSWLMERKQRIVFIILLTMAVSSLFFHLGLGLYSWQHKSLYKDRAKVGQALQKQDYRILGTRRYEQ